MPRRHSESPSLPEGAEDRLHSWKEIAVYLNRDVRTVRRWEKKQGLPVHRHHHQRSASVYAYRSELDRWWKNEQRRLESLPSPPGQEAAGSPLVPETASRRLGWWLAAAVLAAGAACLFGYLWARKARFQTSAAAGKFMLLVLPFQNLTGDPGQEFLVDGFTEEMITQVSQLQRERLGVIARTSAMALKGSKRPLDQLSRQFGVDYVLEGSVRRWGDRVRVTAQLIQARDQTHVWAENFDSDRRDILRLQSDIARNIAEQIHLQLLPQGEGGASRRAVDLAAHDYYLEGRHYLNQRTREDLRKSVERFQQAIARDGQYAAAYAGLADAYNLLGFYGLDPELNAPGEAKIAARKALELDSSLAAAHAAMGYTEFMWQGDWTAAGREFRRALELDDNDVTAHQWYALYLAGTGHADEAVNQMRYAQKLDPLSPAAHTGLGYIYYLARDYEQAGQNARAALQLSSDSMVAHAILGWAYTEQKNYPEAIRELQTAATLSGGVPVYSCGLARAYALAGNSRQAREILGKVEGMQKQLRGAGTGIAAAYLSLGEPKPALRWLESTAPGDVQANWLRVDPAFDSLRDNPRFAAVVERIGKAAD